MSRAPPAGAGQFELAIGIDQKKRSGFHLHDPAGDVEDGGQQFARFGDRVNQGTDLDQALIKIQLALERDWGKRHRS